MTYTVSSGTLNPSIPSLWRSKIEEAKSERGEGAKFFERSGERCELPQRGSGWRPDRPKVFHYF